MTERDDTTQDQAEGETRRKRVAAYCRYSSEGQSKGSIEAQHDAILLRSQREGDWAITWWDEPARSAFVEDPTVRPIWNAMMEAVRAGQFDIVVVYDLSRFSRRGHIGLKAINEIMKVGAQFVSLNDGAADATSPTGLKALGYAAVDAESFSILLGIRALGGMEQRAKRGLHVAHPPFGYRVQNVRDANTLPFEQDARQGDPEGASGDFAALRRLHGYLLGAMTNQEAAAALNQEGIGGRRWSATSVSQIRHNVYYRPYQPNDDRGTVTINGVEYRGQHAAACTWDEWQTMQEVARNRRRGKSISGKLRGIPFEAEFRALLVCAECGSRLWVHRTQNGSSRVSINAGERLVERYFCPARTSGHVCATAGQWIYATEMRKQWIDWLRTHPLPADFEERVRQHVLWLSKHQRQGKDGGDQPDLTRVMKEKDVWEKKRQVAIQTRLDHPDWVSEAETRRRVKEADVAIKRLNHESRNAEQMTIRFLDAARIMTDAASAWEVMTTPERQMAAQLMIAEGGIRVEVAGHRGRYHSHQSAEQRRASGRIVDVRLREPFRDLLAVVNGDLMSEEVAG